MPSAIDNVRVRNGFGRRERSGGLWLRFADLLSVEACFILFVFSGRYKWMPEFSWFPVDLTAAFLVLTLALIVSELASGRLRLPSLGIAGVSFLLFSEFATF